MPRFDDHDLGGVIDLCRAEGWPTYPGAPLRALDTLRAAGAVTVVARDDGGGVVGFAHGTSDGTTAYLAQLLVAHEHRRRGVGRHLVDEFVSRAAAARVDVLVDPDDPAAAAFYRRFPHRDYDGIRLNVSDNRGGLDVPTLPAGDLALRPFSAATDVPLVRRASHDPVIPLITSVPPRTDERGAREWIELQHARARTGTGRSFVIAVDGTAVGQIGLWAHKVGPGRASIGYWLLDEYRGRGTAAQALTLLANWALTERLAERLELYVEPANEASWRSAERAGFVREGLLRRWEYVGDERRDMFMYSRLPEDR